MNITIIFHRLGPYHIARLQAAARYATITCIELSGITQSYQWELIQGDFSFKRITLFANQDSRTIPLRELRGRLFAALERIKIDVLVVNGWSDKGALLGLSWALDHEVPTLVMSESTSIDFKRVLWKEWIKKKKKLKQQTVEELVIEVEEAEEEGEAIPTAAKVAEAPGGECGAVYGSGKKYNAKLASVVGGKSRKTYDLEFKLLVLDSLERIKKEYSYLGKTMNQHWLPNRPTCTTGLIVCIRLGSDRALPGRRKFEA
jgi:hypothetical protein